MNPTTQLAQELAERCAEKLKLCSLTGHYAAIILRELNLESLLADKARLAEIRSAIEKIVVVNGEDSGVILLSDESPTKWSGELKVNVYQHEHFSPLGDALVALYRMTDTDSMSEKKGEQG